MTNKIVVIKPEEIIWPFDGQPYYLLKALACDYGRTAQVDPFPCNTHNVDIMTEEVEKVTKAFPIGTLLQWIVLPHETTNRTNAFANHDSIYADTPEREEMKKVNKLEGSIIFSGKRANIHPAMTRFLVAHEYGHQVDYWITEVMKEEDRDADFRKFYAESRGLIYDNSRYGGGNYHNSITELIADEFRIVVAGRDTDFWQHDKYPNPVDQQDRIDFWNGLKEKYSFI